MKNTIIKLASLAILGGGLIWLAGCSNDKPQPAPVFDRFKTELGFNDAPSDLFGSSEYGENLYNGEISKGYIQEVGPTDTYLQFPINYGYNYDGDFNLKWCYTFYNGGFALSDYHNMTEASYMNQLSVYSLYSMYGKNFVVASGYSSNRNPSSAKYSDYDGCARVYVTDAEGYGVAAPGEDEQVTGVKKYSLFNSVYINNTTYVYLTMKEGNPYSAPLDYENKGWFKVQFITFDDTKADSQPTGYTEVYLANFDSELAGGYEGIIDEWIKVDLTSLPECCVMVVNFVGSDWGEWGLNTPAYCALDGFDVTVDYE